MAKGPTFAAAKLEDEITCPLCLDIFNEPKMLPCHHVYCRAPCLEALALRGRGTITCPECRNVTQIPGNDVNNIPTAFHINRLKEVYNAIATSESTDGSGGKATPTYNCQKHRSQLLDLYCKTCQKVICRDCVLADHEHSEHEYGYIVRIAPTYRESTRRRLTPMKQRRVQLSTAITAVTQVKGKIEDQKAALAEEINTSFDRLTDVLQEKRQGLLHTLEQVVNAKVHAITTQEQDFKTTREELKEVIDSAETAVMNDTDVQFLLAHDRRMQTIDETTKKANSLTLMPLDLPNVTVRTTTAKELHLCLQTSTVSVPADQCTAQGSGLHVGETFKTSTFTVRLSDSQGKRQEINIEATLKPLTLKDSKISPGSAISAHIETMSSSQWKVSYRPQTRGRNQLSVKVNGTHIAGSPFQVFIQHHPTQLREPVATVTAPGADGLVHIDGELFMGSTGRCISIFNNKLEKIATIGQELITPHELAVDHNSSVFISTYRDHKLHKFTKEGVHVKSIGGKGEKSGSFNFPNGIKVSGDNKVYVRDSGNHRIQVFDTDLDLLQVIGGKGSKNVKFNFPTTLDFDDRGDMYVADCSNHQIQVLTPEGKFLRSFGKEGQNPGFLKAPISIHITGKIAYITEFDNNRVSVFDICGQFTTTFGEGHLLRPEGTQ